VGAARVVVVGCKNLRKMKMGGGAAKRGKKGGGAKTGTRGGWAAAQGE
jgi:hypothetical protein